MKKTAARSCRLPVRALALLVCCVLILSGCARRQQEGAEQATDPTDAFQVYYVNHDATGIIAEPYTLEADREDESLVVEELLRVLQEKPVRGNHNAPIGGDVVLRSYSLHGGVLSLDFDVRYRDQEEITEVLNRAAIVRTFSQVAQIDYVTFLVAGEPLTNRMGYPVGDMNADTFIYNAGNEINAYDRARFTLYFSDLTGKELIPVYRTVVYNANIPKERVVAEELIKGPYSDGVFAVVHPDTKVLNVTVQDGTCYVDFSAELRTQMGDVTEETRASAIINSMMELGNVRQVQISAEGEVLYTTE